MEDAGIQQTAFWRQLKQRRPGLTRRMLRWVRRLSDPTKAARLTYCQWLLSLSKEQRSRLLNRVVWLDSKKLYVVPRDYEVYAPDGACLVTVDGRLPSSGYQCKKINYYSAVNAVLGPVYFRICTGTTKYSELPGYKAYTVGVLSAVVACTPASYS